MSIMLQTATAVPFYDAERIRADFPILGRAVHNRPLVFLDSAASAQKPTHVTTAIKTFYESWYSNVHRGAYWLSEQATSRYEEARERVRMFLNAHCVNEIVFTRNATESINLVAATWGRANLKLGDEIVLTWLEHHSNIVPWQILAAERGFVIKVVPVDDSGLFVWEDYEKLLSPRTRLVTVAHVSNVLGSVLPVKKIVALAHTVGAIVLVDGCQAVPHMPVDVCDINCDFYVFSGHKLYGPTGIGVLYGRESLLQDMPPYQGGGDMISTVTFEGSTWAGLPQKFEAGTPAIAQAVGLAAAIDYIGMISFKAIIAHESDLLCYAAEQLRTVDGLRLFGTAQDKISVISFTLDYVHPHDIATIVDQYGVAIRAGHHCAQPLMQRFGVLAMARASFGLYNTKTDIDILIKALKTVQGIFN